MVSFLKSKFGVITLIFLSLFIAASDPLGLDPLGSLSAAFSKTWYFLPVLFWWVYLELFPDNVGRKSLGEIKAEWIQKAHSLIRTVLQLLGMLIIVNQAFSLNLDILLPIQAAIKYLSENLDIAAQAIAALVGMALNIYGFFKDPKRFETRAGNPYESSKLK